VIVPEPPQPAGAKNRTDTLKSRVLFADDHDLVRETISQYLETSADLDISQSYDLNDTLAKIRDEGPFDLVLLDLTMPGMTMPDGLSACLDANKPRPVALLTGTASQEAKYRALLDGAADCLPKSLRPEALLDRIGRLLRGHVTTVADLAAEDPGEGMPAQGTPMLTPRERDVLRGLSDGKSNKEIADTLEIKEVTVKLHIKTLTRKLGARNRTHAALMGRDLHLI
jgi:two-component system, NarL family, nitrate/nitrite response regulator NarL